MLARSLVERKQYARRRGLVGAIGGRPCPRTASVGRSLSAGRQLRGAETLRECPGRAAAGAGRGHGPAQGRCPIDPGIVAAGAEEIRPARSPPWRPSLQANRPATRPSRPSASWPSVTRGAGISTRQRKFTPSWSRSIRSIRCLPLRSNNWPRRPTTPTTRPGRPSCRADWLPPVVRPITLEGQTGAGMEPVQGRQAGRGGRQPSTKCLKKNPPRPLPPRRPWSAAALSEQLGQNDAALAMYGS